MLESLNLELFGAFSAVISVLVWLVKHFKSEAEREAKERDRLVQEQTHEKQKQLEVLKANLKVLRAQLEREQERKRD